MKKNLFVVSAFFLLLQSCSLRYENSLIVEDKTPQFVFTDVEMTRYENKEKKISLNAKMIEQYKDSSASYIKDVSFVSYDDKKEVSTTGECGLLMMDTKKEIYELYDSIRLFSKVKEATVFAESLRWNGKNEQLVSGRGGNVKIQKDDIEILGSGFSASGVSGEYTFTGMVSGNIETK